ncbi:expressed unknown protein [Ectocarpus siliculosus]|uniref:Uncharacterized protein n=1 Tax=Ectocarpus siliculosus TaxID=2880 RepID=D7FXZ4_ECTSI|nr:expressed unknown protein [Ectocarpus siliculosus]|eukprot:CBJ32407.1 expressed unknown protein [Ectocarpus siliculosus]
MSELCRMTIGGQNVPAVELKDRVDQAVAALEQLSLGGDGPRQAAPAQDLRVLTLLEKVTLSGPGESGNLEEVATVLSAALFKLSLGADPGCKRDDEKEEMEDKTQHRTQISGQMYGWDSAKHLPSRRPTLGGLCLP